MEAWLGAATDAMLDAAGVTEGCAVLDVAAGAGRQTLAAARRVGPNGRVLATDISPATLAFAEREAQHGRAALGRVPCPRRGEPRRRAGRAFDAVVSRVGLIYFPDQQAAFAGMRRALRPGGRLAGVVYSTPEANGFFSIPVSVIRRRAELPPPRPDSPDRSGSARPALQAALEIRRAGFTDVRAQTIDAPLRMPSAAECVRFERESFGALHQMLSGLDDAGRQAAWDEIAERLAEFEGPGAFVGPCELLIVSGTQR